MTKNTKIKLLILLLFFVMRLPGLGTDLANSDSARWHRRSERFLTALKSHDFASTYQHYQPGVTLMWINAFVKQAGFSYQMSYTQQPKTLENADYFPLIHGVSKTVLVVVLGAVFLFILDLVSKLFSPKVAHLFGILVVFEPYLIGIDRWFHLTSLETYLGLASFLSILWWKQAGSRKHFALSTLFFVLAVYSKLTSLLLIPLLGVVLIVYIFKTKNAKPLLAYALLSAVLFLILFPALWVSPIGVFNNLFDAVSGAISGDIRGAQITGLLATFYYPIILIFKLSPITLLLIPLGLPKIKKSTKDTQFNWLGLYFIVFFTSLTLADKKIDRYSISVLLPLLLITSILLATYSKKVGQLIFGLVGIFSIWLIISYYPVYSSYYSPIFGINSMTKALDTGLYDNSGEYYYQAAEYMNLKSRETKTWVPHNFESFFYYYKGSIQRHPNNETQFAVTSVDHLPEILDKCPEYEASFGNKLSDVVFVYKCQSN